MTSEQQLAAKAADILERRGHCKAILEDGNGRVCAFGALNLADHGASDHGKNNMGYPEVLRTAVLVQAHIGDYSHCLAEWNNQPERTKQEVIDAFRSFARVQAPVVHNAHEGELVA